MSRTVVKMNTQQPYHKYVAGDGTVKKASPTVDSLLRMRAKRKKAKVPGRLVIRHKREL